MEHPINRSELGLSVTALAVVLALIFTFYFTVRAAVPDLPLRVHHVLADLAWESEEAAKAMSLLR